MRARVVPLSIVVTTLFAVTAARAQPAIVPVAPAPSARTLDVDAFEFTWQPTRIVVGEIDHATITITARDDDGSALDVAPPQLVTSTGTISAPQRQAPGVWTARFTPPGQAFPHVAIVSAAIDTADETAVGFVTLPLWGRGQTTVRTKPGSQVTVVVAADSFGPVVADDAGDAVITILVPPGPEHADAESVDASGNQSSKPLDLAVPGFNRLAAVALDDVVAGDGSGSARLLAFAVDRKGAPVIDGAITVASSVGVIVGEVVAVAPGIFELLWKPGAVPAQTATITLTLDGTKLSRALAEIRVIAGAAARASLVVPRTAVTADENPELVVAVSVFDSADNAVPFGAARVDVDVGRIDRISGTDTNRQVVWVLPRSRAAGTKTTATMTVRAVDGRVLGRREITLLPGQAASLTIGDLEPVVADGSSGVVVVVVAVDAWGNDVVPVGLELAAVEGRFVGRTVDVANRRFSALYVPEPRDEEGVVEIAAKLAQLSSSSSVRLRPRPRPLLLVGPAVGSSWGYGTVTAVGPELSLLVRLPVLDGAVHAGVSLGLLEAVPALSTTTFNQHRTFPVLAEACWRPLLLPDLGLHLGVAGGLVVVDVGADTAAGPLRAIEPGVAGAVVVGVAWRAGPGFLELDGRVGYSVFIETPVVDSIPFGAGLVLGYRFGI